MAKSYGIRHQLLESTGYWSGLVFIASILVTFETRRLDGQYFKNNYDRHIIKFVLPQNALNDEWETIDFGENDHSGAIPLHCAALECTARFAPISA